MQLAKKTCDTMEATGDPRPAQEQGYAVRVQELEDEVGGGPRVPANRGFRGRGEVFLSLDAQEAAESMKWRTCWWQRLSDRSVVLLPGRRRSPGGAASDRLCPPTRRACRLHAACRCYGCSTSWESCTAGTTTPCGAPMTRSASTSVPWRRRRTAWWGSWATLRPRRCPRSWWQRRWVGWGKGGGGSGEGSAPDGLLIRARLSAEGTKSPLQPQLPFCGCHSRGLGPPSVHA